MIELIRANLIAQTIHDANDTCLTVKECAEYLGVHKKTVHNQLKKGSIKETLIGSVWSIPKLQFLGEILKRHIAQLENTRLNETVLVRTLKEQMGVDNRPQKLTRRQREAYIAERIINGNPLTKKELDNLR